MNPSLIKKCEQLLDRYEELSHLLGEPDVANNPDKLKEYSKEFSQVEPLVKEFERYSSLQTQYKEAETLVKEAGDDELKTLAKEELSVLQQDIEHSEQELKVLMLPPDEQDGKNIYLEVRAGTGGDEAALFAGDLFRMYTRYADRKRWSYELINASEGEHGGYKEIVIRLIGSGVYKHLKFESGGHRVQRVPVTETQGRIHTSACTVAVLPEADELEENDLNPADLRIDTFRASGAGGQHVNKTDSAIRITHLPSGIVVECQDERSQHKNRARAMSLLKSKLFAMAQEEQNKAIAQTRKLLVGSGDRSERIRTYNFPQGRVTDHRINLTLYKLETVIEGDLDLLIEPLQQEHQAELLAELSA